MKRVDQRQGFLVSAVIHLTLLMILLAQPPSTRDQEELDPSLLESRDVVFLPPSEVLRQLAPAPAPVPAPTPPPQQTPDPTKKDRISVGPPSELQSKGPLILRREDDLTKVPRGQPAPPQAAPTPAPTPTPGPVLARRGGGAPETEGREGLRLPPGLLGPSLPRGDEGSQAGPGGISSSAERAVDELARRRARNTRLGLPSGTGENQYGLRFDPRGADFTLWMNDFKNQVYRNWNVPQAVFLGYGGSVDFEFTLERDGSMSALRMLKTSGTDSLDRAARNALTSSRFMALPDDYGPPRVTMTVTFHYGPPRDS